MNVNNNFAIVNNDTLEFGVVYSSIAAQAYGGGWDDATKFTHIQIPTECAPGKKFVARRDAGGALAIVEVDDPTINEQMWAQVRIKRNGLLAGSDWTMLPDVQLSDAAKAAWTEYRQALRDIPNSSLDNPDDVTWPPVVTVA